jgi:hypothetical protein
MLCRLSTIKSLSQIPQSLDTDLVNHEITDMDHGELFPQDLPRDMISTENTMQDIALCLSILTEGPQVWDASRIGAVFSSRCIALPHDLYLVLSPSARALVDLVRNAVFG